LEVVITFGRVTFSGLTLANGGRPVAGDTILGSGGGRVFAAGAADVQFSNVAFKDSRVDAPRSAAVGAGLLADLFDDSRLTVLDCRFEGNTVTAASGYVDGGGAWI